VWSSRDYMAVYDSEEEVRQLRPDMARLRTLERLGAASCSACRAGTAWPWRAAR
jgi:hypothetical protein